jgi:hypothetical protein
METQDLVPQITGQPSSLPYQNSYQKIALYQVYQATAQLHFVVLYLLTSSTACTELPYLDNLLPLIILGFQ